MARAAPQQAAPARSMARPARLLLLPLLLLALAGRRGAAGSGGGGCGPCLPERCPPARCPAPELAARDECGCCPRCLGAEGEPCGGRGAGGGPRGPGCGPGLVCVSQARGGGGGGAAAEGTGRCVCEADGAVCGSDGRSYPSLCALRLRAGPRRLRKAHDGECKLAPVIVVPPKKIHNITGAQVYLACEVKAVPTPIITWRKVTESPKGVKLLEELPGDRVNMAIQVRGGPSKHESTGWVLINPLMKEDEGVYQCHATNMVGETQAEGNIKVTEQSKTTNFLESDDMI
ncbi:insulin-like growth factor-binding protein-like 1 [Emydura macquarii macquarii]|uniref:insulin-like growth factor-binding protein-like 1 n=1 Tax=Emydura macquarii macquarii TaxID=1129001 RepID=UPI00352AE108